MYGGVKKFFVDRWLVGNTYRNGFRVMWFPGFLYFIRKPTITQSDATE
jgi:hypothetical protein